MDNSIEMLCDCLMQKKMLFEQYAQHTDQMMVCEIDQLEHYITQRAQLAIEIDQINAEIETICEADLEQEALRDAVNNRGNYGDLVDHIRPVYDAATRVFVLINRIYNKEAEVMARMQSERDQLREKIKEESNTPKLLKYLNGLTEQTPTGVYLGTKYDKV